MSDGGDRGHQKKPGELLCQSRHNFFNYLAHYPAGGASTSGFIRCLVCKTARNRLSKAAYVPARRDSSPHLQCHSKHGIAFQPLNHLLRKQRVNALIHSGVVRFEPPNPPERSPRGAVQDRAHTATPARGLSAGLVIQPTKGRFCRFAKN